MLAFILLNPHLSTVEISDVCGYTRQHVWNLLHADGVHPYPPTIVQALMPGDHEWRFEYCNFMLNTFDKKPSLLSGIKWTDESTFTRTDIVNVHSVHYLSLKTPRITRTLRQQIQLSTNEWCAIFYDATLITMFTILCYIARAWNEKLPLRNACWVWFQYDGSPTHKASNFYEYLTIEFGHDIVKYFAPIQ